MTSQTDPHQYTLKKNVSCCGVGLHSGRTVNITIKPASIDNGIRFFRSDILPDHPIHASIDKVIDTRLATTIGDDNVQISTTEHLMAALKGFGIDNANIDVDANEIPIMDGSAGPFLHILKRTGKKKQKGFRKAIRITKEINYTDGNASLRILPFNGFKITGEIQFDAAVIRNQTYSINITEDTFRNEISRARTFGYVEQVEQLWENGLALGGNLDNVIAIHWNRKTILNEDGLRFDDEFIRHKVLDLFGDLALLGHPLLGHVVASKSGHTQHLEFMKAIAKNSDCWEMVELHKNGKYSVINHVVNSTKAAGEILFPFFITRPQVQMAQASC